MTFRTRLLVIFTVAVVPAAAHVRLTHERIPSANPALPDVYAASPRVKGSPGITPLGEWRFENLWLEGSRR